MLVEHVVVVEAALGQQAAEAEGAFGSIEMNELRSYYLKRMFAFSVALALLLLILEETAFARFLNTSGWLFNLLGVFVSTPAVVVYMVLGERLIRKTLWKLEKPELNFNGNWRGETTYEEVGQGTTSFVAGHLIRIAQDCLTLRMTPATPNEFVNWGPLSLDLAENTILYSYWVDYGKLNPAKFPASARGYAEMKVAEYDDQKKPKTMKGNFWHFDQGQSPVYKGTIIYWRSA